VTESLRSLTIDGSLLALRLEFLDEPLRRELAFLLKARERLHDALIKGRIRLQTVDEVLDNLGARSYFLAGHRSTSFVNSMDRFTIGFYDHHDLDEMSVRLVQGTIGLYFIYLVSLRIPYPFKPSRLIYIGMSESKQNSIGNRLKAHRTGQSGNLAIMNYAARYQVRFTYHALEVLKHLGTENVLELESFSLTCFLEEFGAYPICNNQSGVSFPLTRLKREAITIDWRAFD
jgi:hypothetical protein